MDMEYKYIGWPTQVLKYRTLFWQKSMGSYYQDLIFEDIE